MGDWINLGEVVAANALKYPDKMAFKDARRAVTYAGLNERTNQLANGLLRLGLSKHDRVGVLMDNCLEFAEIYIAGAKAGLVVVPINFRLVGKEMAYVLNNSDAKAFILDAEFVPTVKTIQEELPKIPTTHQIIANIDFGKLDGNYESLIAGASTTPPEIQVFPSDPWVLLYTSGTTGKPKGVLRSHESYVAFYLITAADFGFTEHDVCLTIMPLCHVNSTFFSFTFTYLGASGYIHPARGFDPLKILQLIEEEKITFISLIPTHYNLLLNVSPKERSRYNVSSIRKLLCSSAPVHAETKEAVMDMFEGVELYEAYGSTEAGIVTVLKPQEQMKKLGSIGRESIGTYPIRILDENKTPVPQGKVGELYSRSPMLFDGYYKMPEIMEKAFADGWFTARDMVRQDNDGYYYLIDRKDNMIITGGEHVYPSEVEEIVAQHPAVFDTAVIGIPHEKWGEAVCAVVVLKENQEATQEEIIQFCASKMAGFKKPKSVLFITDREMPRTTTGKILHRKLRERFTGAHS